MTKRKNTVLDGAFLVGPQGFEPRPTVPKTVVLPLDDGPPLTFGVTLHAVLGTEHLVR